MKGAPFSSTTVCAFCSTVTSMPSRCWRISLALLQWSWLPGTAKVGAVSPASSCGTRSYGSRRLVTKSPVSITRSGASPRTAFTAAVMRPSGVSWPMWRSDSWATRTPSWAPSRPGTVTSTRFTSKYSVALRRRSARTTFGTTIEAAMADSMLRRVSFRAFRFMR